MLIPLARSKELISDLTGGKICRSEGTIVDITKKMSENLNEGDEMMAISIYTSKKYIEDNKELYILSNDSYFSTYTSQEDFDEIDRMYMKKIDGAQILDQVNNRAIKSEVVQTKFGITTLQNLSTGLKTLLNIRYLIKRKISAVVNIDECGENVLIDIFNLVDNEDIELLLHHTEIPKVEDKFFVVNNKHKIDSRRELVGIIMSERKVEKC